MVILKPLRKKFSKTHYKELSNLDTKEFANNLSGDEMGFLLSAQLGTVEITEKYLKEGILKLAQSQKHAISLQERAMHIAGFYDHSNVMLALMGEFDPYNKDSINNYFKTKKAPSIKGPS